MRESLLNVNGQAHISGGQFNIVNNYPTSSPPKPTSAGFDRLHSQIAVTALHNALDSFESGRCHPNTRQLVLNDLFQFIQDDPKTRKKWILWLSGPAGSGKTTIARTLAYLCDEKGLSQSSFFFCRMDLTRNGIKPLVATLAYQIACRFPSVRDIIVAEIERTPHIFDLSVEEQFRSLIVLPLNDGGWEDDPQTARRHPIICIIDALDECEEGRSARYYQFRADEARHYQSEIIKTLYNLISDKDSPVIFMLASRSEANFRMAFNQIRHSTLRIYLDNSYEPAVDIRRFVMDKFEEIRAVHPLSSSLPRDWPKPTAVDAIVSKSSGQFIYAATVMQYVSSPWSDPAASLNNISDTLSTALSIKPFIELDALFTFILGRTRNWPVVSIILSCHILSRELSDVWFSLLLESFDHSVKSLERDLMDITSLVEIDSEKQRLIIHNESLVDFLVDAQRSGHFQIKLGRVASDSLMTVLRNRTHDDGDVILPLSAVHLVVDYIITSLPKITDRSEDLENLVLEFTREAVTTHPEPFLTEYGKGLLLKAISDSQIVCAFF
ncbi:hypothetical protein D9619_003953 [Psilocybe cf. subviscida]|uniref:Nephrocystin 3-like N-terminal domain-containing protein n=1 Tax=Psilocybe cf. subviscida TaxID=2480587 RepID=A0A8H5BQW8_9AGAR|nr:hypothetical protein D9619_003953 [Psilocybe cf. subviscida]